MLDKDHVYCSEAVLLGSSAYQQISLKIIIPASLGIYIGCQLPDIDSPNSRINRSLRPFSKIASHFGHRGFTHSLWCWIIFSGLLYVILKYTRQVPEFTSFYAIWRVFCISLSIGYLMHLIEDWFSWSGVIWFYPFGHYRRWHASKASPPIYVRTRIHKWFRYHSTVHGKKGRKERIIRRISVVVIIVSLTLIVRNLIG